MKKFSSFKDLKVEELFDSVDKKCRDAEFNEEDVVIDAHQLLGILDTLSHMFWSVDCLNREMRYIYDCIEKLLPELLPENVIKRWRDERRD